MKWIMTEWEIMVDSQTKNSLFLSSFYKAFNKKN